MAVILWSLLALLSITVLAACGPSAAPRFETLGEFRCDYQPLLPSARHGPSSWYPTYTCRFGNQVIYASSIPPSVDAPRQLKSCLASGGTVTLWRQPLPSAYGRVTFQAACGGHVYAGYATLAANYNDTQLFVRILAWAFLGLSASRLGFVAWHRHGRPS